MKAHKTPHRLVRYYAITNPILECVDMVEVLEESIGSLGNTLRLENCILPNLKQDIHEYILPEEAQDSDLYLTEL